MKYVKSNAFTSGESLGNPAACIFLTSAMRHPARTCDN